ncbi:TetR/AcrR family transcriptional regulator [Kordiimonas gwangyangensis]|uniref:TetR/AcrR family transcriptional regulator n=1 Tax=Kordiimonas gwangyangensis TaxID=288022 RepID=UPI00037B2899|nr:TetR/AcrR family transcriptional regulator [Kordiimonas gwangyangensis]
MATELDRKARGPESPVGLEDAHRIAKHSPENGELPEGRAQMSGGATHLPSGKSNGGAVKAEERSAKAEAARASLLAAAKTCLLEVGFANLSTRKVAEAAGVPLSQIHYHFGSKSGMVLALLKAENDRLIDRQRIMYAEDRPLSARWKKAVEFLEEDMASGYVRLLHEMMAASWSDPELLEDMREVIGTWQQVLTDVAEEAEELVGGYGPFSPTEIVTLVGAIFIGGEAFLLMGLDAHRMAVWPALEKIGQLIEAYETKA